MAKSDWEPPVEMTKEQILQASEDVLSRPDIPVKRYDDIFTVQAVGLDWTIACEVHEPADQSKIPVGADGKKVGIFLLHGGMGDQRRTRPYAKILAEKFGCKVAAMSFPGRCNLDSDNHDWPGDTINPDGTARTPHYLRGLKITPDQYELVANRDDLDLRKKRGTVYMAKAKEGSEFYYRMAGWPAAFEVGGIEVCRRNLPVGDFTVYGNGHSTGGPFMNMLSQRIPNFGGIGAMENSPFGYIYRQQVGRTWKFPFYCLTLRTWRDYAKYSGPEQGLEGMMRLPMLMEEIFEEWDRGKRFAQFKAEGMIHLNNEDSITAAANATAKRLNPDADGTDALVKQYLGYARELTGPDARPVPPLLLGIADRSVDHKIERYRELTLPMYAAMNPAPKVRLVFYHAGTHSFWNPEPGLPAGCAPATLRLWLEAITNGGYYLQT